MNDHDEEETEPSESDEVATELQWTVNKSLLVEQLDRVNRLITDFGRDIGKAFKRAFENLPDYLLRLATDYGWPPIRDWGPFEYNNLMMQADAIAESGGDDCIR